MTNEWFFYFLKKSVSQRKGRFIIAAAAVMLTVTVITALATLSFGVREKMGAELKQYGANMIVTEKNGNRIEIATARELRGFSAIIKDAAFQQYDTVSLQGMPVEIMGTEPGKMTGYRIFGALPAAADELMVGVNLKEALKVKQGDVITFDQGTSSFKVTALFEKGTDEDGTIVIPLEGASRVLNVSGVNAVLLNADTNHLKELEIQIRQRYPALEVKTLRQVAIAEERILGRIQLLMLMVTAVVLFSSVIALGSTMGANVIERMEEIGLMKAIGATRGDIRRFFMSEAALSGLCGALAGLVAGIAAAEAVSRTAFGSFIPVNMYLSPLSLLLGVFISVLATYLPVRDAMKVVPAKILRGE